MPKKMFGFDVHVWITNNLWNYLFVKDIVRESLLLSKDLSEQSQEYFSIIINDS